MSEYDIKEHTHRFAAWAASTAARPRSKPSFSVECGKSWIEKVEELTRCVCAPDNLPDADVFDARHSQWRKTIIEASSDLISHGIAAKLINVYLKAAVVQCSFANHPKVKAAHPPIDRVLLGKLIKQRNKIWRGQSLSWSKFESKDYEAVIKKIRCTLGVGEALWKIEEYWQGHQ